MHSLISMKTDSRFPLWLCVVFASTQTFSIKDHSHGLHNRPQNFCHQEDQAMNILLKLAKSPILNGIFLENLANVHVKISSSAIATLIRAAREGQDNVVTTLVKSGVDVRSKDALGNTALHRSSSSNITKFLLDHGCDVNARNEVGKTPLHNASKYSDEAVPILLQYGADVNVHDASGLTPLHRAASGKIAKILLDHGADPNARTKFGSTPLHFASQKAFKDVISVLLDYGADINSEDQYGHSVLDVTFRHRIPDSAGKEVDTTIDPEPDLPNSAEGAYEETIECIRLHIIKLKVAGLYISEKNRDAIAYNMKFYWYTDKFHRPPICQHELFKYEIDCREEIERVKSHKLNDIVSLYDILHTNKPLYLMDEDLVAQLESLDYGRYPLYGNVIASKYNSDKRKIEKKLLVQKKKSKIVSRV